jgi:hypothetical protein
MMPRRLSPVVNSYLYKNFVMGLAPLMLSQNGCCLKENMLVLFKLKGVR